MKRARIAATVALAAGLALTGCGTQNAADGGTAAGGTSVSPTEPVDEPTDTASSTVKPPVTEPGPSDPAGAPADAVAIATADLATRAGVDVADITVARNDEVTWRDGSLGCAKKGMGYITMLVPGRLIVLEAAGKSYEYHAGARTPPFYCSDPQPPLPPGSSGT